MVGKLPALFFCLLLGLTYSLSAKKNSIGRIKLSVFQSNSKHKKFISPNRLSLLVYLDLFIPLKAYKYMSADERRLITKNIINTALNGKNIEFHINNYYKQQPLIMFSKYLEKKNGYYILFAANYDIQSNFFTSNFVKNSFAKIYIISNKLPVARKYLVSQNYCRLLRRSDRYRELADIYLFDADKANDSAVSRLLCRGRWRSDTTAEEIALLCTEIQYYVLYNDPDEVEDLGEELEEYFSEDQGLKDFLSGCREASRLIKSFVYED
ncbi:MAG TPA: hypothetical protein VKS21_00240 [Spirochaetota bacterium]|nr:hypothetical protein [Spirochaetota bacterium]